MPGGVGGAAPRGAPLSRSWAETAPIDAAGQGPLTFPLATFAVAICNGSFTSTPADKSLGVQIERERSKRLSLVRQVQAGARTSANAFLLVDAHEVCDNNLYQLYRRCVVSEVARVIAHGCGRPKSGSRLAGVDVAGEHGVDPLAQQVFCERGVAQVP